MKPVDPVDSLKALLRSAGSQKALAERLGITPQYLNDILRRRRELSDAMLAKLGLKRVVVKQ